MKRKTALDLMDNYSIELGMNGCVDETLTETPYRFPPNGSKNKAMRWLGFMQGAMYVLKLRTLDDLKEDSREAVENE